MWLLLRHALLIFLIDDLELFLYRHVCKYLRTEIVDHIATIDMHLLLHFSHLLINYINSQFVSVSIYNYNNAVKLPVFSVKNKLDVKEDLKTIKKNDRLNWIKTKWLND